MAERITGQTDRQTDLVFLLVKILFGMILFFSNRCSLHCTKNQIIVPIFVCLFHIPDTLGTLPDIAANARPLRA